MNNREEWLNFRAELVKIIKLLGFPGELGDEIAKNLGSPKAMERMCSYLRNEKPKNVEIIVDEMLAIKAEIEAWKQKKESLEANAKYNELLMNGLSEGDL